MTAQLKEEFLSKRSELNGYLRDSWDKWDQEFVYAELMSLIKIVESVGDAELKSWMKEKYQILIEFYHCSAMHKIVTRIKAAI
jgi:hypothetical protein